jgi:hypothetical protein
MTQKKSITGIRRVIDHPDSSPAQLLQAVELLEHLRHPEQGGTGLSKQREWQIKQSGLGRCVACGKKVKKIIPKNCTECRKKRREQVTKRNRKNGVPEWVPGKPGRPTGSGVFVETQDEIKTQ